MRKHQILLTRTGAIIDKYNQLLDNTGGRFNVFKTIGLLKEETRLHSSFLAELLNPDGSHGLRGKFLAAFIKYCLPEGFEIDVDQAKCIKEYYIGPKTETTGGQIDIIVKDSSNRAIIIENKIDARDQENQMLRYHNHAKTYSYSKLLYLSLDGKIPSEYSTGNVEFDYIPISYKFEIIEWLEECKRIAIDYPLVREGISHYINLIKQLTNTSAMDEMKTEIASLIMQSSENMRNSFELQKSLVDVKISLQWEFWKQLEISLKQSDVDVKGADDSKKVNELKVKGFYEKQRNRDIRYGLWSEIYKRDDITIHWGCEVDSNIYFGFTIEKDGVGAISDNDEYEVYRKILNECDERYVSDKNWLGWQYTDPQLNFWDFMSDDIFSLTEKSSLDRITNEIASKVRADIDFVLSKLQLLD